MSTELKIKLPNYVRLSMNNKDEVFPLAMLDNIKAHPRITDY